MSQKPSVENCIDRLSPDKPELFILLVFIFGCLLFSPGSLYAEDKPAIASPAAEPAAQGADVKSASVEPIAALEQKGGGVEAPALKSVEIAGQPQDAKSETKRPLIINADNIEYSANTKEVIATGNVEVDYKGTKMTAVKMTINTETKDAQAEGDATHKARMEDSQGVKEGKKIIYNFEKKSGVIIDAEFRSNPYFGKARDIEKPNDEEFIIKKGFISTCSMDRPHWRIGIDKVNYFPANKIQAQGATFYLGEIPAMYIPRYNHSLRDPLLKVQLNPGHSKEWGYYMQSIYRTNFNNGVDGRLLLDYRQKMGMAEGYGINYKSSSTGKGDLMYYYMDEHPDNFEPKDAPNTEFQRYLLRWRHKWTIDRNTNFTAEFLKILDSKRQNGGPQYDILKDYFFREYEKDSQPLTYALFHRAFPYSNLDVYVQKRVNHWYDQQDKLPEVRYSMPTLQIGNLPFYLDSNANFTNFAKKEPADEFTDSQVSMTRFDTVNRVSLPIKVAFMEFSPNVSSRQTYYNKDLYGNTNLWRTVFYSGADMSTKFYRVFNITTDFLGLDINNLRHVITPVIGYSYRNSPTISADKLKQFDGVDSLGGSGSTATLGFYNKLQTKRGGKSVDLVDFRVDDTYTFKSRDTGGGRLGDILFHFRVLPYSWMAFEGDATYKHSGDRNDPNYGKFVNVNYDIGLNFGTDRNFSLGERYQRDGGNELTYQLRWRFNPKWKFSFYQRRQYGNGPNLKTGLREQEYVISRDFHCWESDFTWNVTRGKGESIWLVFRLKAFPELEFDYNQAYHQPKPGSQSEPNF